MKYFPSVHFYLYCFREAFDYAEQEQEKDRVRSEQLVKKGFTLKPGTPNYRHQKFFKRSSPKVQELSRQGHIMGHATQYMKRKYVNSHLHVGFLNISILSRIHTWVF